MGYIKLIIILLFIGIALVNALSKLHKGKEAKEKSRIKRRSFTYQEQFLPVEDEISYADSNINTEENSTLKNDVIENAKNMLVSNQKVEEGINSNQDLDKPIADNIDNIKKENIQFYENMAISEAEEYDYQKTEKIIDKIRKLPIFKQAVILSEIVGKPKGM